MYGPLKFQNLHFPTNHDKKFQLLKLPFIFETYVGCFNANNIEKDSQGKINNEQKILKFDPHKFT